MTEIDTANIRGQAIAIQRGRMTPDAARWVDVVLAFCDALDAARAQVLREIEERDRETQRAESALRWKAEALTVLTGWENVWHELGEPGPLGASKWEACIAEIRRRAGTTRGLHALTAADRDIWQERAERAEAQVAAVMVLHARMAWYDECCSGLAGHGWCLVKPDDHFYVGDDGIETCAPNRAEDRCLECTPEYDPQEGVIWPCATIRALEGAVHPQPDQTSEPAACGRDAGNRPAWMSPGQYDPCPCVRPKGHEGPCGCRDHDRPADAVRPPAASLCDSPCPHQECDDDGQDNAGRLPASPAAPFGASAICTECEGGAPHPIHAPAPHEVPHPFAPDVETVLRSIYCADCNGAEADPIHAPAAGDE